jgi:hypothetical protein
MSPSPLRMLAPALPSVMTTEQRIFLPQAKTPFEPRASVNGMVYAVKGMCYRLSVACQMGNRVSFARASLADDATYQWLAVGRRKRCMGVGNDPHRPRQRELTYERAARAMNGHDCTRLLPPRQLAMGQGRRYLASSAGL